MMVLKFWFSGSVVLMLVVYGRLVSDVVWARCPLGTVSVILCSVLSIETIESMGKMPLGQWKRDQCVPHG
ncbi:hypothetical protein A2U01_0029186, partial [Trifolium medium]|nr:hypothetical protein [Trifolium medium]